MKVKNKNYNFERSLERIDEILDSNDNNYEEKDYVPSRDNLTYTNGFYVYVSAIFIDIKDSSQLTETHRRPTLAKIYRSFISEVIAILIGDTNCKEVNIIGDCVSGIFETKTKADIEELIHTAAKINTLIKILNCKLKRRGYKKIDIGIGIDYGRALMIKAGHKGSEINEIVWMGDVVNYASLLCEESKKLINPILISKGIYDNLLYTKQFFKYNINNTYYGNIINTNMDRWYEDNCK